MRKMVNNEVLERVLIFFRSLDMTARDFEARCGIPFGAMSKAKNNSKLSDDNVYRILRAYPRLSHDWLMDGLGSMYESVAVSAPAGPVSPEGNDLFRALYERLLQEKDERIAAKDEEIERLRIEVSMLKQMLNNETETA